MRSAEGVGNVILNTGILMKRIGIVLEQNTHKTANSIAAKVGLFYAKCSSN